MKLIIEDKNGLLNQQYEQNELNRLANGGTELIGRELIKRLDPNLLENFQIIPSRVRDLIPNKKHILHLHDLPNDNESRHLSDPESVKRFDGIVCVSNWQMQQYAQYFNIPYSKFAVIKNAIVPFGQIEKPTDKIRLIYHTTPHRGLEILVPVFEKLCEVHDDIELDVFSSFNLYGWPERDEPYKELFNRCKNNPKIRYHGSVSNDEVREALKTADIYAYPCIWPETSCLSVIEAMAAKCTVVCPNLAVLPETCANFAVMYQFNENIQEHANIFANVLHTVINVHRENSTGLNNTREFQQVYFNQFYSWDSRELEWAAYLQSKLKQ